MTPQPIRIGILGAARIAPLALIAPARATGVAEIVSIAARDPDRARVFAEANGVPGVAENYDALLADPNVEAVYNALPPSLHAALTEKALLAGKAVLCEKPFALSAHEARTMAAAAEASGRVLMEAFHYRYHPLFARILDAIRKGEVGAVRRIEAIFKAPIPESPGELRYDPALGGGALMDLGAYCLHFCRTITAAEPEVTRATSRMGPTGVDLATRATLAFPSGAQAEISCDMAAPMRVELMVEGSDGRIAVLNPLVPQFGCRLEINGRVEPVVTEPTYDFQLRAFAAAVRGGPRPLTDGADAVAQMTLIDAVKARAALS
jgi:predicted dehydrogenase